MGLGGSVMLAVGTLGAVAGLFMSSSRRVVYLAGPRSEFVRAGFAEIWHLDGVAWSEAPLPSRWHRCCAQSYGYPSEGLMAVYRCACGGVLMDSSSDAAWLDRNSRRRER